MFHLQFKQLQKILTNMINACNAMEGRKERLPSSGFTSLMAPKPSSYLPDYCSEKGKDEVVENRLSEKDKDAPAEKVEEEDHDMTIRIVELNESPMFGMTDKNPSVNALKINLT